MCKLHYLLAIALLLGLYGCVGESDHDYFCRVATHEESALTSCTKDANCRATVQDYADFERSSRMCLQR